MSAEFEVGEVVDITIKGARVKEVLTTGVVHAATDGGAFLTYGPRDKQVAVEQVAPAEWPPQPGDLWRDCTGGLWFASDVHDVDETDVPEIVMVWTHENYRLRPELLNQRSGPLTLVHRDEQAAAASSGETR